MPAAPIIASTPAEPPNPFDVAPAFYFISGPHFTPGETAIVRVCVSSEGSIASADVVGSSGDKRFDDFALVWARRVKLANSPPTDTADPLCGPVRVEIKSAPYPRMLSGEDSSLS